MAEDGIESEPLEAQAQEEAYVRLGAQVVFGICLPFLLMALMKLCTWIVFSPYMFLGSWAIGLIIGLVANTIIEFDFQHGYPEAGPRQISGTSGRAILQVEPAPPAEELNPDPDQEPVEPEFWDVNEPPRWFGHAGGAPPPAQDFGLVGQGESQVDQVPPPPSSNTSTRSRPLKLRRSVGIDQSLKSVRRDGFRLPTSLPEISEEESSDENFIVSEFPSSETESAPEMLFARSTSSSDEDDDTAKYIITEQEDSK